MLHKDGNLQITPKKKKVGRPPGSKNKAKVDKNVVEISSPQRLMKRKFGKKRQLVLDDDVSGVAGSKNKAKVDKHGVEISIHQRLMKRKFGRKRSWCSMMMSLVW